MKTYPLFLVGLQHARCVVVGGGRVAARKAAALLDADARLLIIAPELCERLENLRGREDVEVLERQYIPGDLEGAFLVIAATDDAQTNEQVWDEATTRELLVNVVDDPEHCNFIAPSVVRRGPLTLAISTSGRCPALSRHLRRQLEREFGDAYEEFVLLMGELRDEALEALPMAERRCLFEALFESDVLPSLVAGQEAYARRRAHAILEQHTGGGS